MTLKDHTEKIEVIDSKELGKTIRKTNYNLGTNKMNYNSEASQRFVHHGKIENVALNAETMADLRKHHFNLGYKDYPKRSECHD